IDAALARELANLELGAYEQRELLPRDKVRVVLHPGNYDLGALLEIRASPRGGDEVECLGRSPREDQRRRVDDAEKVRDALARVVIPLRGARRQLVRAAVRVRVVVLVVLPDRVEHDRGFL